MAGVTFTAAAFVYDYKDIQVQGNTLVDGVFVVTLANAAKAKIRGFELSANGAVTDNVGFNLGLSALPKANYSEFKNAQVFTPNFQRPDLAAPAAPPGGSTNNVSYDASGSRVIRSPKTQADAGLMYKDEIAGGNATATINYAYTSSFYWQPGNFTREDPYGILNTRVSWTVPSGHYTFSVWGNNLTNEQYSFYSTASLAGEVDSLARPRELGVGVSAKF
jgi:iron complex outermembrane receptor protein